MKVFVIGIAGGVGRRLAATLIARGDQVTGFARRLEQVSRLIEDGVPAVQGDILALSVDELAQAMRGSDAVVFTAGAGGKGGPDATTTIDGDAPGKLAEAAKRAGVQRFVLVSVFPEAWRDRETSDSFEHYIVQKKKAETQLVRTDLDWLIVRPSALTDEPGTGAVDLGMAAVHGDISRHDVAETLAELLHQPSARRLILEVTGGTTPLLPAIDAIVAR